MELHLPSRNRHGAPIDSKPWVDLALDLMCEAFGGAYEEIVVGHWVPAQGRRVREQTFRLVSYADERQMPDGLRRVLDLAARFMDATDQAAVMVAVDGQPQSITSHSPARCP